jgi:hypothetical protein
MANVNDKPSVLPKIFPFSGADDWGMYNPFASDGHCEMRRRVVHRIRFVGQEVLHNVVSQVDTFCFEDMGPERSLLQLIAHGDDLIGLFKNLVVDYIDSQNQLQLAGLGAFLVPAFPTSYFYNAADRFRALVIRALQKLTYCWIWYLKECNILATTGIYKESHVLHANNKLLAHQLDAYVVPHELGNFETTDFASNDLYQGYVQIRDRYKYLKSAEQILRMISTGTLLMAYLDEVVNVAVFDLHVTSWTGLGERLMQLDTDLVLIPTIANVRQVGTVGLPFVHWSDIYFEDDVLLLGVNLTIVRHRYRRLMLVRNYAKTDAAKQTRLTE